MSDTQRGSGPAPIRGAGPAPGFPLSDRQEAFARAYADSPNGAHAARLAGYASAGASHQATRLLARPEVAARVAKLRAEAAAERATFAERLIAKLEPLYERCLEAGDTDAVLQVVELQARIFGLVTGGATVRPRAARPPVDSSSRLSHEDALAELA